MKKNKLIKKLLSDNYELTKELKRLEHEFKTALFIHKEGLEKSTCISTNPENNWLPPGNWSIFYNIFATSNQIGNFDAWLSNTLEFRSVRYSEILHRFGIPPRPEDELTYISSVDQVQKRIHLGDRIDLALSKPEDVKVIKE